MPIDYSRINTFIQQRESRKAVASVLRRSRFEIVWVDSLNQEVWGYYLKLDRPLRQLLGTAREILIWVVEYDEFLARTVMQADKIIEDNRPRLSEDFAIILSNDPNTARYVDETAEQLQTHFVGFSLEEFMQFEPFGDQRFVAALQQRFFSRDLYFLSTAITSPSAFFGRRSLIAELMANLKTGASHVGLFGLRKMGKTSLLYRIIENLRLSGEIYAHVDVQRIDAIQPSAEYLLWSIGEQLVDSNSKVRRLSDSLYLFGKHRMYSEIPNPNGILEAFDHDLKLIVQESRNKVVLLFDEIELMSPEAPGHIWGDSYLRVWRLLRGLNQQMGGKLSYFVTGTNPSCIEVNRFGGRENPTYNYFVRYFLSPLSYSESKDLLSKVGARMGLEWTEPSVQQMMNYVGGHPFLLRALASKVHRATTPRLAPISVTDELIATQVDPFLLEMSSSLSQMIEVLDDYYPDEFMLLETLATGRIGEFRELAHAFPNDVAHLVGYGLIDSSVDGSGLKVELLQSWLQRRNRLKSTFASGVAASLLKVGEIYEGYEIGAVISNKGGFGEVYRAKNTMLEHATTIALKVLKTGSLAALQREVEALRGITHSNIVKIMDYGKFASGRLYIAMEYLDGPTGRQFCDRANRLSPQQCIEFLNIIAGALESMHPDNHRVNQLRKQKDLTIDELRSLDRARHGYIHRDIKPGNVIFTTNRGPVLIDFGIAAKASSPVQTISSTPGYLPPDGLDVVWDPDIDLFQLGLTALQMVTGIEYDGENLADIRLAAQEDLPENLKRVLLKLTTERRADRFDSAGDVKAALRGTLT